MKELDIDYSYYPVNTSFGAQLEPQPHSAVLLLHYFGWCNPARKSLRDTEEHNIHIIEDYSHALLSNFDFLSSDSSHAFFSVRKLGPAPLGGWCSHTVGMNHPSNQLELLAWRSLAARLLKTEYLAQSNKSMDLKIEKFYLSAFEAIEDLLNSTPLDAPIPEFVLEIIAGIDWQKAAIIRRQNWLFLDTLLSRSVEGIMTELPDSVVPLGYVVRLDEKHRDRIRTALAGERVFCPVHWELPKEIDRHLFPEAYSLSRTLLTLPIDQRYDASDMERIAGMLKKELG
jgi:hypothetical protein